MKNQKSLKILGKTYVIKYCKVPEDRWGDCDSPNTPKRQIRISNKIKPDSQEFLRVLTHEITHAGDFTKSEEWVDQFSRDLCNILWKIGYRINDQTRKSRSKNTK
jgi:hypothetical protein